MVDVNAPHFNVNVYPKDFRDVEFSGPDGIAHHRTNVPVDKRVIGNYRSTPLLATDTDYLWRCNPQGTPVHLRSKASTPGEIGWHERAHLKWHPFWTGHGKLMSEIWLQAEDDYTHRYQDAWYPADPGDIPYNPDPGYFYYTKYVHHPHTKKHAHGSRKPSPAPFAGLQASDKNKDQPGYWSTTSIPSKDTLQPTASGALTESQSASKTHMDQSENARRNGYNRLLTSRNSAENEDRQQRLHRSRSHGTAVLTTYTRLKPPASAHVSASY